MSNTGKHWFRLYTKDDIISQLANRLAPEYPFPIGHNDAYESLKWVCSIATLLSFYVLISSQAVNNCASLNASPSLGLIVGGCSAGGNLATSVALRARDDPFFSTQPITGQLIQVPQTIHPDASIPEKCVYSTSSKTCCPCQTAATQPRYRSVSQSWTECAHAPLLSRNDLDMFSGTYNNVTYGYDTRSLTSRFSNSLIESRSERPSIFSLTCTKSCRPPSSRFTNSWCGSHAWWRTCILKSPKRCRCQDKISVVSFLVFDGRVEKLKYFVTTSYPGFPHGGHYAMPRAALSQKYYQDFEQGLGWLLQRIE